MTWKTNEGTVSLGEVGVEGGRGTLEGKSRGRVNGRGSVGYEDSEDARGSVRGGPDIDDKK